MSESARESLNRCVGMTLISKETSDFAYKALTEIHASVEELCNEYPNIGSDGEGMVGFTWENDKHHVNIEFFADKHVEYFAESLIDGTLWSEEHTSFVLTQSLQRHLARAANDDFTYPDYGL